MSSPDAVPGSSKPTTTNVPLPEGGHLWYILKLMECVLVVSCLLMLIFTQYLHDVEDDFTLVTTKNKTKPAETNTTLSTTPSKRLQIEPMKPKLRQTNETLQIIDILKDSLETINRTRLNKRDDYLESELTNWDTHTWINESLKRVKKVCDKEKLGDTYKCDAGPISLNDLLFMFPCSTTLLMVIAMEILGVVFKDPLSKISNLILIVLAIVLAIVLFAISLVAYLRTAHVTLILITTFSALLIIVESINFALVYLS